MDEPRELFTNEPPPPREDHLQDGLPVLPVPDQDRRPRYERDEDYDYGRFRRHSPLASRLSRLGARFIDGFLILLMILPGIAVGVMVGNSVAVHGEEMGFLAGALVAGLAILGLLIYQWYLLSVQGQTIGKKIVGIRVVRYDNESNPGFGGAVGMREWLPGLIGNIPYIGGIFSLVNILCIFGEERRCIHDQMAGTKVIEAGAYQAPEAYREEPRDQWP